MQRPDSKGSNGSLRCYIKEANIDVFGLSVGDDRTERLSRFPRHKMASQANGTQYVTTHQQPTDSIVLIRQSDKSTIRRVGSSWAFCRKR